VGAVNVPVTNYRPSAMLTVSDVSTLYLHALCRVATSLCHRLVDKLVVGSGLNLTEILGTLGRIRKAWWKREVGWGRGTSFHREKLNFLPDMACFGAY